MKLTTNKNVSTRVFHIVGFENGRLINEKLSLAEIVSNNTDTDTELLYTLQEFNIDAILDLKINENLICKSSRDHNENCNIIICRI